MKDVIAKSKLAKDERQKTMAAADALRLDLLEELRVIPSAG